MERKYVLWNRTLLAEERVGAKENKGFYEGRRIIGRDTPINGGVSIGGSAREAIVVDYDKSPKLQEMFRRAYYLSHEKNVLLKDRVIFAVYRVVDTTFKARSKPEVRRLSDSLNVSKDCKISLDIFAEEGIGVCRQMALASGVLLEKFCNERLISGKTSVDRNEIPAIGAHMWTRYVSSDGRIAIIDVMQGFCGNISDSLKINLGWEYFRPEDKRA